MSLPLKIAIGTLGSGAVAVGGYEAVSYATGKPGLIIHRSESSTNNTDSNSTTEQTEVSEEQKAKSQITSLLEELKNGCEIKVRETSDNPIDVSQAQDLNSLLAVLQGINKDECKTQKTPKKQIILKHSNSSWAVFTEQEQIKDLLSSSTFHCGIKIKVSGQLKTIESVQNSEVSGLLPKLEALDVCKNLNTPKIHKVFENKTDEGWTEVTDEKEKVDAWLASESNFSGDSPVCELKIFSSDLTYKNIDSTVTGLYSFLEKDSTVKDTCTTGTTTNKQEIVIHQESNVWKILDEKAQILELMKENSSFKCKIKIKNTDSEEGTLISSGTQAETVVGLIKYLKEIKDQKCSGTQTDLIVHKPDGNGWDVYETYNKRINDFVSASEFKCTVQVKTKSDPNNAQEWSVVKELASLEKLLKAIEGLKEECKNEPTGGGKTTVVFKESDNHEWNKEPKDT